MTKITEADVDRIRAECESLGLEFRDTIGFYREWELAVAMRALRKLVPAVVTSDDPDLHRDFEVLMHVVGTHWKGAHAHQDRRIQSGRRGKDTEVELQERDQRILEAHRALAKQRGTSRGTAGTIKRTLNLPLTERQIRAIIKKSEITS
jgi:hypothetical protein